MLVCRKRVGRVGIAVAEERQDGTFPLNYTDVMNLRKTTVAALLLFFSVDVACADGCETDSLAVFEGEVSFETNYGHNYYGEDRTVFDFPHIEASGSMRLGKGWSLSAEFEYERFYEDGVWCSSFKDMFSIRGRRSRR